MKFVKFNLANGLRPVWLNAGLVRIVGQDASGCVLSCRFGRRWLVAGSAGAVAAALEAAERIGAGSDSRTAALPAMDELGTVFGRLLEPDDVVAVEPAGARLAGRGAGSLVLWDGGDDNFHLDALLASPEFVVDTLEGRT